jgi:hypothetical protein
MTENEIGTIVIELAVAVHQAMALKNDFLCVPASLREERFSVVVRLCKAL